MTDRAAAAAFTLMLVCFTTYLCFRGIAWVIQNGWRSMLGLVALRGEAVIEWQDDTLSCGCRNGGVIYGCIYCPNRRCPEHRNDGHSCAGRDDLDALVDAINEDRDKAHFDQWENEFGERTQ